jgi:phage terminase Nu1 subunit (DNA packaging protein)
LKSLALNAETPEDFEAARELLLEHKAHTRAQESLRSQWSVKTLAEVAEFFGYAVQTVKNWRTETPPMPGGGSEGYDLSEVVKWKIDRLNSVGVRHEKHMQDLERGRVKLEGERLELAKLRKTMVEMEEVEAWASVALSETRDLCMQLPGLVVAALPREDQDRAIEIAENHVRDILTTLRKRLEENAFAPGDATTGTAS